MKDSRRDSLKIIGAIGATCAYPFSAGELYGQHAHPPDAKPPDAAYHPLFFNTVEYQTLAALTDAIIPPTDTPGAAAAGVPRYIDGVVSANKEHRKRFRDGLRRLDHESRKRWRKPFRQLAGEQQAALLTPLSEAVDSGRAGKPEERFFRVLKNMTADGYYTSRVGLVDELGYSGNTVLAEFPACLHEH